MSWYNKEDWVHVDEYGELEDQIKELERQLRVASEDEAYLEQRIDELQEDNRNLRRLVAEMQAEREAA
jgi:phage shock protein A